MDRARLTGAQHPTSTFARRNCVQRQHPYLGSVGEGRLIGYAAEAPTCP